MLRIIALLAFFSAFISPLNAQEKVKKTETLATASKLLVGKIAAKKDISVQGATLFLLVDAQEDGALQGNLVVTLTVEERKKIAAALEKNESEIPATLTAQNVLSHFVKGAHCPEIQLAFAPQEFIIADAKLQFEHFVLVINDSPQKLARALCIFTERANKGITNKGVVQYINFLLHGEPDDEAQK